MKTLFFAVATLAVVACQQNTKKEVPPQGKNTPLTPQEETTPPTTQEELAPLPKTDWEEEGLKGKVKTLTKILYRGTEKNGKIIKKNLYTEIVRYSFNTDGYYTLEERFSSSTNEPAFYYLKFLYNDKKQLIEEINFRKDKEYWRGTYLYNKQGDCIMITDKLPDFEAEEKHFTYVYTPEGKQKTFSQTLNNRVVKTVTFYNKKNLILKEEVYTDDQLTLQDTNTYDEHDRLVKWVSSSDNGDEENLYTYDSYGNLISYKFTAVGTFTDEQREYQYDEKGNILQKHVSIIFFSAANGSAEESHSLYTYTYDDQGNILTEIRKDLDRKEIIIAEHTIEYYQ
jgi:lipoprotein